MLKVFLGFRRFVIGVLHKIIKGTVIIIRDLFDVKVFLVCSGSFMRVFCKILWGFIIRIIDLFEFNSFSCV